MENKSFRKLSSSWQRNAQLQSHMASLNPDILYHLGLTTQTTNFIEDFGDVRFVVVGGTPQRMEKFAYLILKELRMPTTIKLENLAAQAQRYALFKAGPVLCASHGMGGPSISILLHELIKLLWHAKCREPMFFRLGTCGGIGIAAGTVVISSEALDPQLRAVHEVIIHGKVKKRNSVLDAQLAQELKSLACSSDAFATIIGKTLCTDDFYEEQSRLDGAFCEFGEKQKFQYLQELSDAGVVNMEMESKVFAAMTRQAQLRAAVLCVAIVNRLAGDQITETLATLREWEERPAQLLARYIRQAMNVDESLDSEPNKWTPKT